MQQSLINIVCIRVQYGYTIFTDEYRHITHWKNIDSYIKVSIIRKKDMQMIPSMLITVNAEAIVPIMDKKVHGYKCNLRIYSKTFQLFITIEPRQKRKYS